MQVKPSKYNYIFETKQGDWLLYNTLVGKKSCCRINPSDIEKYKSALFNVTLLSQNTAVLYDKQFLVNIDNKEELQSLEQQITNSETLNIIINPTEQCNFRCTYCYELFENGKMSNEIIELVIKYIESKIGKYKKLYVSWFGGEPLLAVETIEYLSTIFKEICKKNGVSYYSRITTNGYLLTPEIYKKLIKCNIFTYQITIDGTAHTHDSQRILKNGSGTYSIILKNLLSIKNIAHRRCGFVIRINFTKESIEDIPNLFLHDLINLIDDESFSFDIQVVSEWVEKTNETSIIENKTYRKALKNLLYLPINVNISNYYLEPLGSICSSVINDQVLISSNGDIKVCTMNKCVENFAGNIKFDYNEETFKSWRYKKEMCKTDKCSNCFFLPVCMNSHCPANGIIYKQSNACPKYYYNLDILLQLLDKNNTFSKL